jgi:fructose-1,6-bisphosphatase I
MNNQGTNMPTWQKYVGEAVNNKEISLELGYLLADLTYVGCSIGNYIRFYGLSDEITGGTHYLNQHGEQVKKLDLVANSLFIETLQKNKYCAAIITEEEVNPVVTGYLSGKYIVFLDPLDGSSNIDSHVSTGAIYSVYERKSFGGILTEGDLLQPGSNQVAAGYFLYSSSTITVGSWGCGVQGFTYHPLQNQLYLTHPDISIPECVSTYSVNEGYIQHFPPHIQSFLSEGKREATLNKKNFSIRYIGSMVADMHRTLLKGGIFLYPSTKENSTGKLRLMYECNPFSYLIEKAGGKASNGLNERILEILPQNIHQRTPVVMGSLDSMTGFERFVPEQIINYKAFQ